MSVKYIYAYEPPGEMSMLPGGEVKTSSPLHIFQPGTWGCSTTQGLALLLLHNYGEEDEPNLAGHATPCASSQHPEQGAEPSPMEQQLLLVGA